MKPLFSTSYFPPVAYMAAIMHFSDIQIEAMETFPKQTYRNRMEIMTADGIRTLSVPTLRNNHSRTDEVGIDYKEHWNIIHLRTIEAAYSASPFYQYYKDDIEALLLRRYDRLLELNQATLEWLLDRLKKPCTVTSTTDFMPPQHDDPNDYRNRFTPKHPLPANGFKPYYQVFNNRQPFAHNLSTLDLMFNLGPEARDYLITLVL